MSTSPFKTFILFFAISSIHLFGQDLIDLRHHFQAGDVYAIEQSTTYDTYVITNNKESAKNVQRKSSQTLTILQVNAEGNAQAKLSFDDSYFSEAEDVYNLYPKGQDLLIVLKPSGEVIDVSGQETLVSALFEKLPNGENKEKALKELLSIWGEKNLKKRLSASFCIFPDQSVSLGKSWERSEELEIGFKNFKQTTTTYTAVSPFEIQFMNGSKTGKIERIIDNQSAVYELVSKGKGTIKIASLGFTSTETLKSLGTLTIKHRVVPLESKITKVFKMEKKPSP